MGYQSSGSWKPPMKGWDERRTIGRWLQFGPRAKSIRPEKQWQPPHALRKSNSVLTKDCSREVHRLLQPRRTQFYPLTARGKKELFCVV
jgi:hypothetical protein